MNLNSLFKNISMLFSSQLIGYAISFALLPYLARIFGVDGFAQWSFAMNAMTYVAVILEFGFILLGTKKIVQNPNLAGEIAINIYIAKSLLVLLCFCVVLILPKGIATNNIWFAAFFVSFAQSLSPIWLFQGLGHARISAYFTITAQIISAILIFAFIKSPDSVALALMFNAVCFFVINIAAFLYAIKKFAITLNMPTHIFTIYKEAKNIFLSNIAISIYVSMIGIVIGFTLDTQQSGQFFGAQKIILTINALFVPITQAIYPLCAQNKDVKFLRKILLYVLPPVTAGCIILLVFSNEIVTLLLGAKFVYASTLLAICSFTPLLVAINTILGTLGLIAFGYEKTMQYIAIIVAVISAPLAIALCNFGAIGAAMYMSIIEACVLCMLIFKTKKLGII